MRGLGTILVVALLLIGGYLLLQPGASLTGIFPVGAPNTGTVEISPAPATRTEVNYTDTGFSPDAVTVKTGTTVVWKNVSANPVAVESDPHPQHTSYPPMNENGSTSPGGEYSFTFTEPGTYNYHNHLAAQHTGTVVVTE